MKTNEDYKQISLRADHNEQRMIRQIKQKKHLKTASAVIRVAVCDMFKKICDEKVQLN